MDWSTLPYGIIGPSGLISFVIYLILTDRLVWHRRLAKRDERITILERQNVELLEQNGLLLRAGLPTVIATLDALRQSAERD